MTSAAIQPFDSPSRFRKLAQAIRQWPLGVHLLLSVNVPMVVMLSALLVTEYRDEMEQATLEKESGLADEAIAVHQAVLHLAHEHGTKSTEAFVRRVCATVDEVARGELGITINAPVGRELQALALSFNSMREQLATNERRRR